MFSSSSSASYLMSRQWGRAYFGDYGDAEFGYVFRLVLDRGAEFFGFIGEDVARLNGITGVSPRPGWN